MRQSQVVHFVSENGKVKIYAETDTPLGELHDFLMLLKGHVVDRMVNAQKEEQEVADAQKKIDTEEV